MYKIFTLIGLLLLTGFLQAQRQISLEDAKSMALEQNAGYLAKKAEYEAAKWQKTNAFSAFLPNLSLGGTYLYMDPARTVNTGSQSMRLNKDQRSISLNLSQVLFAGGKLYQSYKIAALSAEMIQRDLTANRLQTTNEVEAKYYSVLQMKEVYSIAQAEYEQAGANLELAELKLSNGLLANADYLRFQADLANKDIALLQSETAYELALRDFSKHLGSEELLEPLSLAPEDNEILPFADLARAQLKEFGERLLEIAKADNLSLQNIQNGVELSRRVYKISKGNFLPSVSLVGSRAYDENGIDRYEFEASNQIMLNLSVPLLPQVGNVAASRKAYYDSQRAVMEAKGAQDGIMLGISASVIKLVSSARQVKNARLSLSITEEMYAQLSERFRLNMISAMEFMDAEIMLSAARMAHANAYYEFMKARLALLNNLGSDDDAVLHDILSQL